MEDLDQISQHNVGEQGPAFIVIIATRIIHDGIIIPDSAKEKPAQGKVVAVGPGKVNDAGERVELQVKENDVILFSKYGGTDVKLGGEDYLIMREDDVLGIVE